MPTARSENAAAVVEHMIYVPGGFGGEQTLEAYDTTTDTWKALADLPEPRHHLMSASYAGKVYIFGGARVICIERLPYAGIATYDLLLWRDRFLLGKWNIDGQHAEPTLRV